MWKSLRSRLRVDGWSMLRKIKPLIDRGNSDCENSAGCAGSKILTREDVTSWHQTVVNPFFANIGLETVPAQVKEKYGLAKKIYHNYEIETKTWAYWMKLHWRWQHWHVMSLRNRLHVATAFSNLIKSCDANNFKEIKGMQNRDGDFTCRLHSHNVSFNNWYLKHAIEENGIATVLHWVHRRL